MLAITHNPVDWILAAALGAAVVIGLVGYLTCRPRSGDPDACRCMFCRDLRAGR